MRSENVVAPKGAKDLVEEPGGFDDGFLNERGAQTRFKTRSRSDFEIGFFTEARSADRFKPVLLGPGDVKLKRVALKVRRMIGNLPQRVGVCLRLLSITAVDVVNR